jgi:hypothetical protein
MPEVEPNSLEDFADRMNALQKEAREYGIDSVCVLLANDQLSREEAKAVNWFGGWVTAIGMLEYAKAQMFARYEK